MKVIVETAEGPFFVQSGSLYRDIKGSVVSFSHMKLTTSKRCAAEYSQDDAYEIASTINVMISQGYYPQYNIQFAR